MESFYDHCQDVHMRLLHALNQGFGAQGINIDLVEKCKDNVSELRLNYYPRIDIRDIRNGSLCRISEHTDFGTVTLLLQDSGKQLFLGSTDVWMLGNQLADRITIQWVD